MLLVIVALFVFATVSARQMTHDELKLLKEAVESRHGHSGGAHGFQGSLTWDSKDGHWADLDLALHTPDGTIVYFGKKIHAGNTLDIDSMPNNISAHRIPRPVENIYSENPVVIPGKKYTFVVHHYSPGAVRVPFNVRILVGNTEHFSYSGETTGHGYKFVMDSFEPTIPEKVNVCPSITMDAEVQNVPLSLLTKSVTFKIRLTNHADTSCPSGPLTFLKGTYFKLQKISVPEVPAHGGVIETFVTVATFAKNDLSIDLLQKEYTISYGGVTRSFEGSVRNFIKDLWVDSTLERQPHFMMVGSPGSSKTTWHNYVATFISGDNTIQRMSNMGDACETSGDQVTQGLMTYYVGHSSVKTWPYAWLPLMTVQQNFGFYLDDTRGFDLFANDSSPNKPTYSDEDLAGLMKGQWRHEMTLAEWKGLSAEQRQTTGGHKPDVMIMMVAAASLSDPPTPLTQKTLDVFANLDKIRAREKIRIAQVVVVAQANLLPPTQKWFATSPPKDFHAILSHPDKLGSPEALQEMEDLCVQAKARGLPSNSVFVSIHWTKEGTTLFEVDRMVYKVLQRALSTYREDNKKVLAAAYECNVPVIVAVLAGSLIVLFLFIRRPRVVAGAPPKVEALKNAGDEDAAAADKKKADDEAAATAEKKASSDAATKKKADDEAAATEEKKASFDAADKKKADDEAAATEEKKASFDAADKKKADDEAAATAAKKNAEYEAAITPRHTHSVVLGPTEKPGPHDSDPNGGHPGDPDDDFFVLKK